jgi:hypothetical protein
MTYVHSALFTKRKGTSTFFRQKQRRNEEGQGYISFFTFGDKVWPPRLTKTFSLPAAKMQAAIFLFFCLNRILPYHRNLTQN